MDDIDPKIELHIEKKLKEHRSEGNRLYAIKLVERVIFYGLGMIGVAVLGAVIKLIIL
jgi:hypothetical protein